MLKRTLILTLLAIAVALVACAPSPTPAPPASPTTAPTAIAPTAILQFTLVPTNSNKGNTPVSTTPSAKSPQSNAVQVTQARDDLAKRLSIAAGQIELISFQSVTWPDGSLGCPKPGLAYIQVLTPGYRIQLAAAGKLYEYHASKTGEPFLCDKPQPPASVGE